MFYRSGWLRCDVFNCVSVSGSGLAFELVFDVWCYIVYYYYYILLYIIYYIIYYTYTYILYIIYYIIIHTYTYYIIILYSSPYLIFFPSFPTLLSLLIPILYNPLLIYHSSPIFKVYVSVLTYTYLYSIIYLQQSFQSYSLFPLSSSFKVYVSAFGYPYLYSRLIQQSDPACFIGVDG